MNLSNPNRYPAPRVAAIAVSLFAALIAVSTLADHSGAAAGVPAAVPTAAAQGAGGRFVDRYAAAALAESQLYDN